MRGGLQERPAGSMGENVNDGEALKSFTDSTLTGPRLWSPKGLMEKAGQTRLVDVFTRIWELFLQLKKNHTHLLCETAEKQSREFRFNLL